MRTSHNLLRLGILSLITIVSIPSAKARSIVITLTTGTQVYYQITSDNPPRMVLSDDGTFTMNGQEYTFDCIVNFFYTTEDYNGAEGTADGIVSIDDKRLLMKGEAHVYSFDGKLVSKGNDLNGLAPGTYIITDGTTSLKLQKR